jgi:hypothetical protein
MRWLVLSTLAVGVLTGCNQYGYRYAPGTQILGAPVFADCHGKGDQVEVLVDTNGRQLRHTSLVKSDGTEVAPLGVTYPEFREEIIGGMAGVDAEVYSVPLAQGPTVVKFDRKLAGDGPWQLKLNMLGVPDQVEIAMGGSGAGAVAPAK